MHREAFSYRFDKKKYLGSLRYEGLSDHPIRIWINGVFRPFLKSSLDHNYKFATSERILSQYAATATVKQFISSFLALAMCRVLWLNNFVNGQNQNSPNKGKLFITIYSGIVNTLPLAITGQFLLTNQYKQILVLESN